MISVVDIDCCYQFYHSAHCAFVVVGSACAGKLREGLSHQVTCDGFGLVGRCVITLALKTVQWPQSKHHLSGPCSDFADKIFV